MMRRGLTWLLWMAIFLGGSASAQVRTVFDGCTDQRGASVRSIADPSLTRSFVTRIEAGAPVIRYNSAVLPRLRERARLFFYAHECARFELGLPAEAPRTVGDAWRADCRALETLGRSGLVRSVDIAALQGELLLTDDEWNLVPGPQREIDLPSCLRGGLPRPPSVSASLPAADQKRWNACVHACADTLLACQTRLCGDRDCPRCMPDHDSCVAACELPAAR